MENGAHGLSARSRPALDGKRGRTPASMASVDVEDIDHRILAR
jgi:hypothetical protein